MKEPNTREIAEHWFKTLKSTPGADSWNIDDSFVDKLAATWPWVQVYFDILSRIKHGPKEEFSWAVTLGVYALKETLGLRFDCAAAFLMLLLISRVTASLGQALPEKVKDQCTEAVSRLSKSENDKLDQWLKWFDGLWEKQK